MGLPGADLRAGVTVLLGLGASEREVGELALDTGVVDCSILGFNRKKKKHHDEKYFTFFLKNVN